MTNNRQMAVNITATIIAFAVSTGITFFLTPFIVGRLGRAAYGFIGLSSSIIDYTSLITIALNAMAGRFVSISYLKGDKKLANKYFSSVFFSNLFFAGIIFLFAIFFLIYIDVLLDVPSELLRDVRLLFGLLVLNSMLGLVTGEFGVATFIKNRLELSSIRNVIADFLRAAILLIAFSCFAPHVWYIGLSGLILTVYTVIWNIKYRNRLTPDLRVNIKNFDLAKVKELISSGAWNIITKLSNILSQGLDLLFANIFVGAAAMGTFSISKTVPMMALALMGAIASAFAPQLTNYYAQGRNDLIVQELQKSIRVVSCFSTPILCSLYVFSGDFYHLWLPGQDYRELWLLTVLGFIASPFTMPQEALWNVFTITNKLKYSSLTLLGESIGVFCSILVLMNFVEDHMQRLIILACTRTVWGFFRSSFFLPMYAAHCLQQRLTTFYKYLLHSVLCLIVSVGLCFLLRSFVHADSWLKLIMMILLSCVIGFTCNFFGTMTKHDRGYLLGKIGIHIK